MGVVQPYLRGAAGSWKNAERRGFKAVAKLGILSGVGEYLWHVAKSSLNKDTRV